MYRVDMSDGERTFLSMLLGGFIVVALVYFLVIAPAQKKNHVEPSPSISVSHRHR